MTGFSQGGMMSYRQLCAHAEQLASVAPVAGGGCFDGQEPAVEVPILYIHGHDDLVVSWSAVAVPQRDAVLAAWDFGEPDVIESDDNFTATRWTTSSGTPFELWEHDFNGSFIAAGHCLPGPDDGGEFRCEASEFDQAEIVLDFFAEHPRAPR
jgi:poly(3-hydroxybutyrate) depolymerase